MRADVLSPDDSNANMFGYLRVDAGWLWKPKRLLIHTAPTAASVEIRLQDVRRGQQASGDH